MNEICDHWDARRNEKTSPAMRAHFLSDNAWIAQQAYMDSFEYDFGRRPAECACEACDLASSVIGRCNCGELACCLSPAECACVCHGKET